MAEHVATGHLDDETLAAYVDGRLTAEEKNRVEAAIAADPERYEWLVNTLRAVDSAAEDGVAPIEAPRAAETATVVRFPARAWIGGGIGLAAAAALAMAVLWPREPSGLEMLVAAAGPQRYVEGRITGGFQFGPLRSETRGAADDVDPRRVALVSAAAALRDRAEKSPSAESLHDYGIARLLLGDSDAAIRLLTQAIEREDRAALRSDLAAAYAHRARLTGDAADWARALDETSKALAREPDLAEALYTRALATQNLRLPNAADAWETYLRRDASGPWADDARQRLARLAEPPAAR